MKAQPAPSVAAWIVSTPEELTHLSVITIGEIRKGIDLLDEDEPKRGALQSWLDHDLRVRFPGSSFHSINGWRSFGGGGEEDGCNAALHYVEPRASGRTR